VLRSSLGVPWPLLRMEDGWPGRSAWSFCEVRVGRVGGEDTAAPAGSGGNDSTRASRGLPVLATGSLARDQAAAWLADNLASLDYQGKETDSRWVPYLERAWQDLWETWRVSGP
jgi:hypothetical protein